MLCRKLMLMILTIWMLARGKVIYYDEIKDQLHDVSKDISSKADDTSAEVDDDNSVII